jgi:hypothetical protein
MTAYFEPDKGVLFQGKINYVGINDPAPAGHTGNLVLDRTKDFTIDIQWQLSGNDVPLYLDNPFMESNWRINVFAESMGPGSEIVIYNGTEPKGAGADPKVYTHSITVPKNTLPEHIPNTQSGVYKLIVTVFLNNTSGFGYDLAGCHEGPMIMVEDPV